MQYKHRHNLSTMTNQKQVCKTNRKHNMRTQGSITTVESNRRATRHALRHDRIQDISQDCQGKKKHMVHDVASSIVISERSDKESGEEFSWSINHRPQYCVNSWVHRHALPLHYADNMSHKQTIHRLGNSIDRKFTEPKHSIIRCDGLVAP